MNGTRAVFHVDPDCVADRASVAGTASVMGTEWKQNSAKMNNAPRGMTGRRGPLVGICPNDISNSMVSRLLRPFFK